MTDAAKRIGTDDEGSAVVIGTFNVEMQLSTHRKIVMTGHVYNKDDVGALNARIDLFQDAVDRQFIRIDIGNKEAQLTAQIQNVRMWRDELKRLNDKQGEINARRAKGDKLKGLAAQELTNLENGSRAIEQAEKAIEQLTSDIATAKKKIGME